MQPLLRPINKNKYGEYDYNQLLKEIFGEATLQKLAAGQAKGSPRHDVDELKGRAASPMMGDIGRRLLKSGNLFEDKLKTFSMMDEYVTLDDVYQAMSHCNVKPTQKENQEITAVLSRMQENRSDRKELVIDRKRILISFGLADDKTQKVVRMQDQGVRRRILQQMELKRA